MTEIDHAEISEMAASEEHHQRLVAVLIITVTLLGAVIAFLQTQASNRESTADRNAQQASVATMTALVETTRKDTVEGQSYDESNDLDWAGFEYENVAARPGSAEFFAGALGRANRAAARQLAAYRAGLFGPKYRRSNAELDLVTFLEDEWKPFYRSAESQKAYAAERDGWSGKSDRYITVITVFAVALFLLGLSLTVPGGAQKPFLGMGSAVGLGAAMWGLIVFTGSVEKPVPTAIEAYVQAQAKADFADSSGDEARIRKSWGEVVSQATRAIKARDDYTAAYRVRAGAYFRLDFLRPRGPRGSGDARDDLERATSLEPGDYIGWGNLGAAQFWLDDYRAALRSTERALELQPDDAVFNMNRALVLSILGDEEDYADQLGTVRQVLANEPSWLRNDAIRRYGDVFRLGLQYRRNIADGIARFRDDLHKIDREITNSLRLIGQPTPRTVDAKARRFTFALSDDRRVLEVHFEYEGMKTGQRWLYDVYLGDERQEGLSAPPERWRFDVPDGGLVLTLTRSAWKRGDAVRVEIFVEGSLIGVGRTTIR